jgi:hypothetical protein
MTQQNTPTPPASGQDTNMPGLWQRWLQGMTTKLRYISGNLLITLGDQVGANKLSIRSAGDVEVFGVNSLGQVTALQAWQAASLQNSWANFGGSQTPAGYWKDPFGIVHVRGLIYNGTGGNTAFTLPAGYRPAYNHIFPAVYYTASAGLAHVDVSTSGTITPQITPGLWLSLDSISFRTV